LKVPQIGIDMQYGAIVNSIEYPTIKLKTTKTGVDIKLTPDKLTIKSRDAEVDIDPYPSWYDMGYLKINDLRKKETINNNSRLLEIIAQYVKEGNKLMKIENKGDPLVEIAKSRLKPREKEIILKGIRGPSYQVTMAELQVQYNKSSLQVEVENQPVKYQFKPGKVESYLARRPRLEIYLKEEQVDRGFQVDICR